MAGYCEEPAVSESILEKAKKDAETLDWLSIPSHQRIIGDDLLEQYCDVPFDFLAEHQNDEENVKPEDTGEPLKKKFKVGTPPKKGKGRRFIDLTTSIQPLFNFYHCF